MASFAHHPGRAGKRRDAESGRRFHDFERLHPPTRWLQLFGASRRANAAHYVAALGAAFRQDRIKNHRKDRDAPNVPDSHASPPRLRLVRDEPADAGTGEPALVDRVRATRHRLARFLRALHMSGHTMTRWSASLVSRLAHADAVTARYIADPYLVDDDAARASDAQLRAIESWVWTRLPMAQRSQLRALELAIRIDPQDLLEPLVQPDRAPEDEVAAHAQLLPLRPRSLRAGLHEVSDAELLAVGRRLGLIVRPASVERAALEEDVHRVLRDDHLLGILVATLPRSTLELLAALVRDAVSATVRDAMLTASPMAVGDGTVGPGMGVHVGISELRGCGLAFVAEDGPWVPVELRRRLDGVLRAQGL